MTGETFEHKLRLVLEPDTKLLDKAMDEYQKRLQDTNKAAGAPGASIGPGAMSSGPVPAGSSGGPSTPFPTTGGPIGGGKPFASGTPARELGKEMAQSFADVLRGRQSPFYALMSNIQRNPWSTGFGQRVFGLASPTPPNMSGVQAMTHRMRHPTPRGTAALQWLGTGGGGGAASIGMIAAGGVVAAASTAMIVGSFARAIGQFVEGTKLYMEATGRLIRSVVNAEPAELVLAATQAQQASIRSSTWRSVLAGTMTGGLAGAAAGAAVTGGPGAIGGGLVGAGIGAVGGAVSSSIMGWLKEMELQIQEKLFSGIDGLMRALDNYNSTIFGLARQFEMKQIMFMFKLGQAVGPLASAWFGLKNAALDLLSTLISSGALKPILAAIIGYLNQIKAQLPQIIGGLLIAIADLLDAFIVFKNIVMGVVDVLKAIHTVLIGLLDFIIAIPTMIPNLLMGKPPMPVGGAGGAASGGAVPGVPGSSRNPALDAYLREQERALGLPEGGTKRLPPVAGAAGVPLPSGLSGIAAAIRAAGEHISKLPAPTGNPDAGGLEWQKFTAGFAGMAFPKGAPATTRGLSGYPGTPAGMLGAPMSGAQMAAQQAVFSNKATARAAAKQMAQAPITSMPKFVQNINLEFKAKLWHERAVSDAINQVRERLLAEMGTVKNEARLSISLFDARLSALTL